MEESDKKDEKEKENDVEIEEPIPTLERLNKIYYEIKISYTQDCDRTEYMKETIEILKSILKKDTIEEYFKENKDTYTYFMETFVKGVINMITLQQKVYGENGDDIALELLLNFFKLFLKYHKNSEYSTLFERLRNIFNQNHFFNYHTYNKKCDLTEFNSEFCSQFQKEIKKYEVGDEVDFPYTDKHVRYDFLKRVWLRGRIKEINDDRYEIEYFDDSTTTFSTSSLNLFPKNTKTVDWDWRLSLKKYDVIDCFDRNKWYPATILEVKEETDSNGFKTVEYKVSFRLYVDHFKNPYDEEDTYEKHIEIWKTFGKAEINTDNDDERYVGEGSNCDEGILFYSKRIQKFGTYSTIQQKYVDYNYSYNNNDDNELKRMNDDLSNDTDINIEEHYFYEKDGTKNYILGKYGNNFNYILAKYLKLIENIKGYDTFIEILKSNPNIDEIYNVFYYLFKSLPYLHKEYFIENKDIIKTVCVNYINNLDEKQIRKLPKELNDLVTNLIYQINIFLSKNNPDNTNMDIYDEITLAFAMKSIKTNIFDYRLKGIKDLNDIIEKHKKNKDVISQIIILIKDNKILNEIFGANYHSQLITRSNEIIKLLLQENALDENDMTLIWSCTKRGDLEAKLTILKLLSSIAENLKENHIEMLLNSVLNNVDKKINNEEIEFVYKLSTQNFDNEKNINQCCEYLCQCYLMSNLQSDDMEIKKILEKIIVITSKDDKYLKKILNICENNIEKNEKAIPCFNIIKHILEVYNENKAKAELEKIEREKQQKEEEKKKKEEENKEEEKNEEEKNEEKKEEEKTEEGKEEKKMEESKEGEKTNEKEEKKEESKEEVKEEKKEEVTKAQQEEKKEDKKDKKEEKEEKKEEITDKKEDEKKNIEEEKPKEKDNDVIIQLIKDNHLITLFENNLNKYLLKAKEEIEKNKIPFTEGDTINNFVIDDYSHLDNIKKRLEILLFLINQFYPNYDFLPLLKNVLLTNPVGINDQLIFYDFIKNYISDNSHSNKVSIEHKEKIRQEIFDIISQNDKGEITLEQLKLFIANFFDMNKDKIILEENTENKIKEILNFEELVGLDKLWNIIFQINDEKILSFGINIIYQIYQNNNIDKLLEKCNTFIKEENKNKIDDKLIEKYITLMKAIIIESEKNILFTTKSHLSLLKNCFINLPIEIKGKELKIKENAETFISLGNTNFNDLKLLILKLYDIPTNLVSFSFSKKFSKILKAKNGTNESIKEKEEISIDESYNNISLYELVIQNYNNNEINLLPKEKILFSCKKPEEAKLLINGEINPKFKKILHDWFYIFTEGSNQMDEEGVARFIRGVTAIKSPIRSNDSRINTLMKEDKDKKGYVNEEEFIQFFDKALKDPHRSKTVWNNLENMGYTRDLKKEEERDGNFTLYEKEKLPRYKLGNDLIFLESLIKTYYEIPSEKKYQLIEFLLYLATNEIIYKDILNNLFNNENKDDNNSFIIKAFNDKNKYIELNYIFIIIESFLQDLELYLYNNKYIDTNELLNIGNGNYKLISAMYEPFDDEENIDKKLNFVKKLIKTENCQKIINHVNELLEYLFTLIKENKEKNNISLMYDFCLRGIKLLNILNNFCSINNEKEISKQNIKQNGVYYLGNINLSQLFEENDFQREFDNLSYKNLTDNLINILTKVSSDDELIKEKENNLKKECFDLLIKILSCNKQLLENYKENDNKKDEIIKLFKNKISENESKNKDDFIKNIINSVTNAEHNQNKNYIEFLSKLVNNLLDTLINPGNIIESPDDPSENSDKNKNKFTPDTSFFELYNHLHKINSSENNNTNNESLIKIYELIMKHISNSTYQNKSFLSFLQLLNLQMTSNEELKTEILFKTQEDGKNLINFLIEQAMPELQSKEEPKEEIKKDELIKKEDSTNKDNKFILIENIKEEKPEDNDKENIKQELNQISNDLLLNCFNNVTNSKIIGQLLKIIYLQRKYEKKNGNKNKNEQDSDDDDNYRGNVIQYHSSSNKAFTPKKFGHVGLKNLGCICYMNSIMQQMYMVPTFRYAIMSADDNKDPNPSYFHEIEDDNLLHQLQIMYTYLTFSNRSDFAPKDFCYSYKDFDGKPTNVRAQQDSQEFYNNFCDKIENCLKETKYKYIVSDVFMGQSCSSVECSNCKNISNRFEDYYNLTLEVKNISNLNDSLNKMGVPEIIDDFKCSNCNQKVRISKITSLNKLPNVLVVHLKRFYLNYEIFKTMKINSKYEFPKKLNLKQFCVSEIQKNSSNNNNEIYNHEESYYEYELKGINVHTGSADGGHYFSFIDVDRDGKNNLINTYKKENWLQFNDSKVLEFDTDTIPTECYGGNYEGSSYENCQNAYLLIYERKKKTPIRVLYKKEEIDENDKENLIVINKDNKKEIFKTYDLSRLDNNEINEDELYKKTFFDEEKKEYFKYIPFYSVPKYAPTDVYKKIMAENNTKEETQDSENNNFKINKLKYEELLANLIKESKFDINNKDYDEQMKQAAIETILDELLKSIGSPQEYAGEEGDEEFNNSLSFIFNNLLKPMINKETSDELLKLVYNFLTKEVVMKFIFTSNYGDNNNTYLDKITNESNAKTAMQLLSEFVKIYTEKKQDIINKKLYSMVMKIINQSNYYNKYFSRGDNNNNNETEEKYKFTIKYLYQLLENLIRSSDKILNYYNQNGITLCLGLKIGLENEEIRKIVYSLLKYIIKNSTDYTKELFDIDATENLSENKNIDISSREARTVMKEAHIIKKLIKEDFELFILFMIIATKDDVIFFRDFFFIGIVQVYEYMSQDETIDKMDYLIKILYSLSIVNNEHVLERYLHILGYPNPIIRDIPRDNPSPELPKQKWPIFGEKLINGNIDTQIYEFVNINRRNKKLCLLGLLLPNDNDENNDMIIPKEKVKDIIIKLIENCLGEKNNYSLFKYLYLNPARSLRYENLYQEMKQIVLNEDKEYNFEKYSEKEGKFIQQIEKEVEHSIKDFQEEGMEVYDDEENFNPPPSSGEIDFKCEDKNMKQFIGFNCNIIPGEIIREEIVQIAKGDTLAMYRIEYYSKYFDTKELREKLLNKKEEKEDKKEDDKENENKDKNEEIGKEENVVENKDENKEGSKEKKDGEEKIDEKTEDPKKEEEKKEGDNKDEVKKEEGEEKKEEEKKEGENKEQEKKGEEQKKEENKEETKEEEPNKEKQTSDVSNQEEPIVSEPNPEEPKNSDSNPEEPKESPEEVPSQPQVEQPVKESEKDDIPTDEEDNTKKEVQPEQEPEQNIPLETEIDDSLEEQEKENNKIVKKFDVSSETEENFIYGILPKGQSTVILEDNSIKDKNKVKRVLFRYILTNKSKREKSFRAVVSVKNSLSQLKRNNSCYVPEFIFDNVGSQNITNFYNVMRIRGEFPFMERDKSTINIDLDDSINFNRKQD